MKIRVECHACHRGDQKPRALLLRERRLEVREVLDRWLDPAHRYFKVRVDDGQVFILRHDEGTVAARARHVRALEQLGYDAELKARIAAPKSSPKPRFRIVPTQ